MVSELIQKLNGFVKQKTGFDPAVPLTERLKQITSAASEKINGSTTVEQNDEGTKMKVTTKPNIVESFKGVPTKVENLGVFTIPDEQAQTKPTVEPANDPLNYVPPAFAASGTKPVPQEHRPALQEVSTHTGLPLSNIRAQFGAENGETWDPTRTGPTQDIGITQLTPPAIETVTKPQGSSKESYWKQNYEEQYGPFDKMNPVHQILAAGIYFNYLKNEALPAVGITKPTDEQIAVAYNMGSGGVRDYVNGLINKKIKVGENTTTIGQQYNAYLELIKKHGWASVANATEQTQP